MDGQQRGELGMAYDLISEAWGDVQSPRMLIEFKSQRELVLAELEKAMTLLRDIAIREDGTTHGD